MTFIIGLVAVFVLAAVWLVNEWRIYDRDRRMERLAHRNLQRGGLL